MSLDVYSEWVISLFGLYGGENIKNGNLPKFYGKKKY